MPLIRKKDGFELIKHDKAKLSDLAKMVYNRRFKYWLGRTRAMNPERIHALLRDCEGASNPPALFNWYLKNEKSTKPLDNKK